MTIDRSTQRHQIVLALGVAIIATLALTNSSTAQVIQGLPRVSPHSVAKQTIGIADVQIDYHRPAVRGREVWGAMVPYGAVWRAGANDNTTVHFSHPVTIEGQPLAAGTYGLHMIPTEDQWTVIFSTNSTSWGSFTYDESEDALRVQVEPIEAPFEEWLRYGFDDLASDSATLYLRWAGLEVPLRIATAGHELVLEKLRNDLRSQPRFTWQGWAEAAAYCQNNNINHAEALQWIDRSIAMHENFQNLFTKAGLLEQTGNSEQAGETLTKALESGSENQLNNAGYQMLAQGRTDVALMIFGENVKRHPESWNVHDSLAEGLSVAGDTAAAIEHYTHALQMAPEGQHARIEQALAKLRSNA